MSVVCFDLIPDALEVSQIAYVIAGIIFGIATMIYCDLIVQNKFNLKNVNKKTENSLLKTGIIVSIGLAIHNIPEGLAIGSGFEASLKLGLSLAIAICLHDVPERYKHGYTDEKWWYENMENYIICSSIWNSNRRWGINWSDSRLNITKNNFNLFKLCSWCYALHRITVNCCQKQINYILEE